MISDRRRPATCTTNFIHKNIKTCTSPSRRSSAPISTLGVRGVSILLRTKEKFNITSETRHLQKQPRKKLICIKPETYFVDFLEKKVEEAPPPQTLRVHSGVRKTSIKSKESLKGEKKSSNPQRDRKARFERTRWFTNRQVLALPVTNLPAPVRESNNSPGLYLKVPGQGYQGCGQWEALDHRPQALDRLLAAMEKARQGQSNIHVQPATRLSKGNESNQNQQDPEDSSYQQVYQRHVDTLTSVIAQDQSSGISKQEGSEIKRAKRKGPPKLEIKIAPADQSINSLTEDLEDFTLAEQVDNCGDLTPVITYNHVSTVSTPDEFQYGKVSPGTSNKGSRSPSPLLEVPNLTGEISTKFPTV